MTKTSTIEEQICYAVTILNKKVSSLFLIYFIAKNAFTGKTNWLHAEKF